MFALALALTLLLCTPLADLDNADGGWTLYLSNGTTSKPLTGNVSAL